MARYPVRAVAVRYRVEGDLVAGCLYRPQIAGPQAGVLVIAADGSDSSQIQGVAERYAHVGYPALLVDLHGGRLSGDFTSEAWTAANLKSALAWLRERPFVQAAHIGAVGFADGGEHALRLTGGADPIQAAVAFYPSIESLARIVADAQAPTLTFYGREGVHDEGLTKLQSALTAHEGHAVIVYPAATAGFFNERSPAFQIESAEDAWSRSNKFFYRYLGEPTESR